jgi:phenylalanyl-tRNA synthetase alpha chain
MEGHVKTLSDDISLSELLELPPSAAASSLSELQQLIDEERERCLKVTKLPFANFNVSQVDDVRVRFTGRKSPLQDWLKALRNYPADERKEAGAKINQLKSALELQIEEFVSACRAHLEEKKLVEERIDLTLPLPEVRQGSRHPVSLAVQQLLEPLKRLGFTVIDGPELEREFYNFEALNIPSDHPAREMQDTFFVASGWVLRTHTSSVQAHAMMERGVPLRVACAGFTYRNELDLTHVPTFRQIECLVVDKGITLAHMRSTLDAFFAEVFGRPVKLRLRSSYFPFTEPSAEIDVQCQQCFGAGCRSCKHTGWLEMGGCGLVNTRVLEQCGIDSKVYSGFAFGMGVDRIAMSKFGIADLRSLFEGDVLLSQQLSLR